MLRNITTFKINQYPKKNGIICFVIAARQITLWLKRFFFSVSMPFFTRSTKKQRTVKPKRSLWVKHPKFHQSKRFEVKNNLKPRLEQKHERSIKLKQSQKFNDQTHANHYMNSYYNTSICLDSPPLVWHAYTATWPPPCRHNTVENAWPLSWN